MASASSLPSHPPSASFVAKRVSAVLPLGPTVPEVSLGGSVGSVRLSGPPTVPHSEQSLGFKHTQWPVATHCAHVVLLFLPPFRLLDGTSGTRRSRGRGGRGGCGPGYSRPLPAHCPCGWAKGGTLKPQGLPHCPSTPVAGETDTGL